MTPRSRHQASLGLVDRRSRTRSTWAQIGVHFDGITGGLSMIGIAPVGWTIPPGTPVTLPPHVLAECDWPGPNSTATNRLFVTENPSVLTACLDDPTVRMICTSGKPSALAVENLAALDAAGWQLMVRADSDDIGITSVNTILANCPSALPWRMSTDDYRQAVAASSTIPLRVSMLSDASWDQIVEAGNGRQRVRRIRGGCSRRPCERRGQPCGLTLPPPGACI